MGQEVTVVVPADETDRAVTGCLLISRDELVLSEDSNASGGGPIRVSDPSSVVWGRKMITCAHFLQRTFTPRGPILSSAIMY